MSRPRWFLVLSSSLLGLVTASSATLGIVSVDSATSSVYGQDFELEEERLGAQALGRSAYDFRLTDIDDEVVDQDDVRDTPYALLIAGTPCRVSARTASRLVSALEEHEQMRALVVVYQPARGHQAAPNLRVAARTFSQQHVEGKEASERVQVGLSDEALRVNYGSLVYGTDKSLDDVPALFTVDKDGIIRAAHIGDASEADISEALAAAVVDEEDDE